MASAAQGQAADSSHSSTPTDPVLSPQFQPGIMPEDEDRARPLSPDEISGRLLAVQATFRSQVVFGPDFQLRGATPGGRPYSMANAPRFAVGLGKFSGGRVLIVNRPGRFQQPSANQRPRRHRRAGDDPEQSHMGSAMPRCRWPELLRLLGNHQVKSTWNLAGSESPGSESPGNLA